MDDQNAAYPLTIDPLITSQEAALIANDAAWDDAFGGSVALVGDTALVGAPAALVGAGRAHVFRLPELAPGYNRLAAQWLQGATVRLTYVGLAGTNYALDRTFNLTPTVVWTPQATNPAPADGTLILTNPLVPTSNNFWRMRSVP